MGRPPPPTSRPCAPWRPARGPPSSSHPQGASSSRRSWPWPSPPDSPGGAAPSRAQPAGRMVGAGSAGERGDDDDDDGA
eukprot:7728718-Pyramimonas_sp.AAC.1